MTNAPELIDRAEAAAQHIECPWIEDTSNYREWHHGRRQLIRDLITALQAAPTAEKIRHWADACDVCDGHLPTRMRAAADRMEGK